MKKFWYVVDARFPTEKAHGIQVAKMCEALLEQGVDLELVIPARSNTITLSPQQFYGLRLEIPCRRLGVLDLSGTFIARLPLLHEIVYALLSLSFSFGVFVNSFLFWRGGLIFTRGAYSPGLIWHKQRVIWEVHELPTSLVGQRMMLSLARRCRLLVCPNKAVLAFFLANKVPKRQLLYLPNGVDVEMFSQVHVKPAAVRKSLGLPARGKLVVYTGSFYLHKGVETLAEALKKLPDGTYGVLAGGPERERKELGQRITNEKKIIIMSSLRYPEIPLILAAADILVLPNSAREALSSEQTSPLKLFEYLAANKPLVLSDVPGVRQVVGGVEGVWFFRPDDPESLAEAIRQAGRGRRDYNRRLAKYSLSHRVNCLLGRLYTPRQEGYQRL